MGDVVRFKKPRKPPQTPPKRDGVSRRVIAMMAVLALAFVAFSVWRQMGAA